MGDQENKRPKNNYSIQKRGLKAPRMRHHNPGTKRQPPSPNVKVLSSIVVAPPRYHAMPIPKRRSPISRPRPLTPEIPWTEPKRVNILPEDSAWRRARSLVPVPAVDYRYGYEIVPGDAFGPVPLFVDRDQPWTLRPIDLPVTRTVHFYRADTHDPRMHDFRVEVTPHPMPELPSTSTEGIIPHPMPVLPSTSAEEARPLPIAVSPPTTTEGVTQPSMTVLPSTSTGAPRRRRRSRLIIIG